jgi:protein TonB
VAENLFRDIVTPSIAIGGHSRHTVPVSIVAHVMIVVAAFIVPLVATDRLPQVREMVAFVAPSVKPVPPPPPPPKPIATRQTPQPQTETNLSAAPVVAPAAIVPEQQPLHVDESAVGIVNGVANGLAGSIPGVAVVPAPPPPAPLVQPLHPGGDIRMPTRIKDVAPVYPAVAREARVEGLVIIEATISTTGEVEGATVLRGHPLLNDAALEAVRQWRYSPTLLNGVPVPVIVTVTVRFALR